MSAWHSMSYLSIQHAFWARGVKVSHDSHCTMIDVIIKTEAFPYFTTFCETLAATKLLPVMFCQAACPLSQRDDMVCCTARPRCLESCLSGNIACSFPVVSHMAGLKHKLNRHYDSVRRDTLLFSSIRLLLPSLLKMSPNAAQPSAHISKTHGITTNPYKRILFFFVQAQLAVSWPMRAKSNGLFSGTTQGNQSIKV